MRNRCNLASQPPLIQPLDNGCRCKLIVLPGIKEFATAKKKAWKQYYADRIICGISADAIKAETQNVDD